MKKIILTLVTVILIITGYTFPLKADISSSIDRLAGNNRFETSKIIAERYNDDISQNIVITADSNFAEAFPAVVFAHTLKAPILFADQTALDYANNHLAKDGTAWIIGDASQISTSFINNFAKVKYIKGLDMYETAVLIARKLENIDTIVITSGDKYPDTLSMTSFAAYNNWPILLVGKDYFPPVLKEYLQEIKPTNIYLVGGHSVISYKVEDQIRELLPAVNFERFQGYDRFETSAQIISRFAPNPQNLYFATGYHFADALVGSVLAAKTGDPIILSDPNYIDLPLAINSYIAGIKNKPYVHVFGGQMAVSDETVINAGNKINEPAVSNADFVNLAEYIPSVLIDLPYATTNNFTKAKIYDDNKTFLRKGTADKLRKAVEELDRAGYHVKIWDAYRPPKAQFKMWSIVPNSNYVANPYTGYSNHSRGSAVDLTIENLSMPTEYDNFTTKASRYNQNDNAKFLESVMVKYGFKPLATEWWHFDDSDKYEPTTTIKLMQKPTLRPNYGKQTY